MLNDLYAAAFLQLYRVWKRQHKTIADSALLLQGDISPSSMRLSPNPERGDAPKTPKPSPFHHHTEFFNSQRPVGWFFPQFFTSETSAWRWERPVLWWVTNGDVSASLGGLRKVCHGAADGVCR